MELECSLLKHALTATDLILPRHAESETYLAVKGILAAVEAEKLEAWMRSKGCGCER